MSLECGYECHMIGGPWIAENPNCPIHSREAVAAREAEEAAQEASAQKIILLQSRIDRAVEASNHGRAKDAIQDMLAILQGEND